MKTTRWFLGMSLAMLVGLTPILGSTDAHAAATIVIINNDGPGEGFNDTTPATPVGGNTGTTVGEQRLIAFTYAAELWGECLESSVTIEVLAQMDPQFCNSTSAVLGSAGTTTVHRDFTGAPAGGTWYPQALANSLAGSDLSGNPDINATFNSNLNGNPACLGGTGWYYGLDQNPGSDIDFVSVVLHEIGHGLGFQTFVSQTGTKFLGFNDHYMIYLENHGATPSDYPSMSDGQRAAANVADPNLHWTGPIVNTEAAGILSAGIGAGGHVRMHGPNPYQGGSSVSHWSTALSPSELMEPSYTGANHDVSLALELMDEIGWTLAPKSTGILDGPATTPRFTLSAPYPNPISANATVGFTLEEASEVTIAVYDVSGRLVSTAVENQRFGAGPGQVVLDARNLTSGVYFVRMTSGANSVVRKMAVVR